MVIKNCKQCNKEFNVKFYKRNTAKFCSRECYGKWISKNLIGKNNPNWKEKISVNCLICNKEFNTQRCWFNRGQGKYCSRKCLGKWNSIYKIGENHPSWKGGINKIKRNCLICKTEFITQGSVIKLGEGKFCSRKCYGKWYSENLGGKNSHLWKGGITPLNHQIRGSKKYKNWRTAVFKRDNFTCIKCKHRGGALRVDHIKPFSIILYENKIKSLVEALNCIYLWNLDNGRTLCLLCDLKFGWKWDGHKR